MKWNWLRFWLIMATIWGAIACISLAAAFIDWRHRLDQEAAWNEYADACGLHNTATGDARYCTYPLGIAAGAHGQRMGLLLAGSSYTFLCTEPDICRRVQPGDRVEAEVYNGTVTRLADLNLRMAVVPWIDSPERPVMP